MNYKNIVIVISMFITYKGYSQTLIYHPNSLENYKNSQKWVTIIDRINDVRLKPGTDTTLLFVGGFFSNQVLTVIIKDADKKFQYYPVNRWFNKDATISGNIVIYEGKPAIVLKDSTQINVVTRSIVSH